MPTCGRDLALCSENAGLRAVVDPRNNPIHPHSPGPGEANWGRPSIALSLPASPDAFCARRANLREPVLLTPGFAARIAAALAQVALAALASAAGAANLTIGLGADVTALDPHYHNVTPNNNVAAHLFGYLVQRNEKSQLEPGLATEWKTIDPLT